MEILDSLTTHNRVWSQLHPTVSSLCWGIINYKTYKWEMSEQQRMTLVDFNILAVMSSPLCWYITIIYTPVRTSLLIYWFWLEFMITTLTRKKWRSLIWLSCNYNFLVDFIPRALSLLCCLQRKSNNPSAVFLKQIAEINGRCLVSVLSTCHNIKWLFRDGFSKWDFDDFSASVTSLKKNIVHRNISR